MNKESWEIITLEDICYHKSSSIVQNKLVANRGQYPLFGASSLVKNIDFYHQDTDYIAIVKDGSGVGRVDVFPAFSSLLGTMQYIFPKDGYLLRYVAYALKCANLSRYATGIAIPYIYFKDYSKAKIKVYKSLPIQEQIVKELDTLNDIIAKKKEQLAELDTLAQATFYEMFGDPVDNIKGWDIQKMGNIMQKNPQNGLYKHSSSYVNEGGNPILRIDGFYNGKVTDISKLKRLICSEKEIKIYKLEEDDIVINRVNSIEYLGKSAHIHGLLEPTVFESNMMGFHVDKKRLNPQYLITLLNMPFIYSQILNCAKKAVNQASINQKDVSNLIILLPPLSLQNQFAEQIEAIEGQKELINKSIKEVQLLFDYTMDKYFN